MRRLNEKTAAGVIDEVLHRVRLTGSVYCRPECNDPWGVTIGAGDSAYFHIVTRGECRLEIPEREQSTRIRAGDLVILPFGDRHILRDHEETPAPELPRPEPRRPGDPYQVVPLGRQGNLTTSMICGGWSIKDRATNVLLAALPPLVHIATGGEQTNGWLFKTLELLEHEVISGRPGSDSVVSRLSEVIFIQALRVCFERLVPEQGNWVGALQDPAIGTAVAHMIRDPAAAWSVPELARRASISRSAFATRFRECTGVSPIRFLRNLRLGEASRLLRETDATVSEIAGRVGYESPVEFSKIFSKQVGVAPAAFRERERSGG